MTILVKNDFWYHIPGKLRIAFKPKKHAATTLQPCHHIKPLGFVLSGRKYFPPVRSQQLRGYLSVGMQILTLCSCRKTEILKLLNVAELRAHLNILVSQVQDSFLGQVKWGLTSEFAPSSGGQLFSFKMNYLLLVFFHLFVPGQKLHFCNYIFKPQNYFLTHFLVYFRP